MENSTTLNDKEQALFEKALATSPSTLLEDLPARTRITWFQLILIIEIILILFFVLMAYLDGILLEPFDLDFWRINMFVPVMFAYALAIQPAYRRFRQKAISAFRPLVSLDDEAFQSSYKKASLFNRRREWIGVMIGVLGGVLVTRPWDPTGLGQNTSYVGQSVWLSIYGISMTLLMYGVMGFFVYSSLSSTRLFSEIHQGPLRINIFNTWSLEPIGQWSLVIALSYIGGMTLSVLFLNFKNLTLESLAGYPVLIITFLLVFFLNLKSIRDSIVIAKQREIQRVREELAEATSSIAEGSEIRTIEDNLALIGRISTLEGYIKQVQGLPEWPLSADIKRRLALSSFLPGIVGMIRGVLPDLLERFVPPEVLEALPDWLPFP
jgi:hypothetical protein